MSSGLCIILMKALPKRLLLLVKMWLTIGMSRLLESLFSGCVNKEHRGTGTWRAHNWFLKSYASWKRCCSSVSETAETYCQNLYSVQQGTDKGLSLLFRKQLKLSWQSLSWYCSDKQELQLPLVKFFPKLLRKKFIPVATR